MLLRASVVASSSWLILSSSSGGPSSPARLTNKGAGARELLEIARDLDLGAEGRTLAIFNPDGNAGQVVTERLGVREGHGRLTDAIDQLLRFEAAIDPHTLGKPLYSKQLAGAVPRFRQSVGIKEEHVSRIQRDADLFVNLVLADTEWQVLSLQHRASPSLRPEMNRHRMSAVDEIDGAFLEIEPGIADRHKTLELDELPCDLRVRERHDVFRFRKCPGLGERNQPAERLQKVTLGRRAEECRGNTLAHDVADDDVEAVVPMLEEVVEVTIDALRWNGERRHTHAGHVAGRLVEQERLLDLEADLDLLLARPRQFLLRPLALGDVFRDADEILWRSIGADDWNLDGVQVPQTAVRCLDGLLRNLHDLTAVQYRAILRDEEAGLFLGKEIVVASSDCGAAVDAQGLFFGSVPPHEFQVPGVLDEEHDRQVFEHRVEKAPRIFEFSRPFRQGFFGAPVLRHLLFQLRVGSSQLG